MLRGLLYFSRSAGDIEFLCNRRNGTVPVRDAFNEVVRRARFTLSFSTLSPTHSFPHSLSFSISLSFSLTLSFFAPTSTLSTRDAIRSLVARLIRLRRYRGIYSSTTIFTGRGAIPPLRWIFQQRSIGNGGFLAAERAVDRWRVEVGERLKSFLLRD